MPLLDGKSAALLTKTEAALIRETAPAKLRALSPARLRTKVARARKLRDKYASLARRQKGEAKGTVAPRGQRRAEGSANTTKKAEIFTAALARVEGELARRDEAAKKAAAKAAKAAAKKKTKAAPKKKAKAAAKKGAKTAAKKKTTGKKPPAFAAANEAALPKRALLQKAKSGLQRSGGHMAGRNRRNQARRDARG
ncbi:MAG: hypothetical protein KF894_09655 [Labilithrix sp.]|nr:hypothetical protein [Labilithrix sp.]